MYYVIPGRRTIAWEIVGPPEVRSFAKYRLGAHEESVKQQSKVWVETAPLVYDRAVAEFGLQHIHPDVTELYTRRMERRKRLTEAAYDDNPIKGYEGLFKTQYSGAKFALAGHRVLVLDEVGTGKTRLAALAATLATKGKSVGRVLVVCPSSSRLNWEREIKTIDSTWQVIIPKTDREGRIDLLKKLPDRSVTILNWEILAARLTKKDGKVKQESQKLAEAWQALITRDGQWQVVIADEVHRAKDRKARQSEVLHQIAPNVPYVFGLTATPTDGKPEQWWSVLRVVDPWRFGAYWRFAYMFNDWHTSWDNRYVVFDGPRNTDILSDVTADYAIRRMPGPESGIPPKRHKIVYVEMDADQRAAYTEMKRLYKVTLENGNDLHALNALSQQLRLRQVLVHPALIGARGGAAKIDALLEILGGLDRNLNCVVYSSLVNSIGSNDAFLVRLLCDRIKRELGGDWEPRALYGQTPESERHEIQDWLRDGTGRVVVLSTQAGGTAINLQGAQVGIFLDRPPSSLLNHQAEGRLPRPGSQARFVLFIDIVFPHSVDEYLHELPFKKQEYNESVYNDLIARYVLSGGE